MALWLEEDQDPLVRGHEEYILQAIGDAPSISTRQVTLVHLIVTHGEYFKSSSCISFIYSSVLFTGEVTFGKDGIKIYTSNICWWIVIPT